MLTRLFLLCCRIAYQRNDDDEEEAARERRRRARQERLRQKQEEESLGQVTDQVEVHTQNRYCPLQNGKFLSCFLACLVSGMCWAKHSPLSPTQLFSVYFVELFPGHFRQLIRLHSKPILTIRHYYSFRSPQPKHTPME